MSIQLAAQNQFLATGISGLDDVLCGGLRRGAIVIVEGLPGTGKTTLASELAFRAASELQESTVFISFESSEELYLQTFAGFGWTNAQSRRLKFMQVNPETFVNDIVTGGGSMRSAIGADKSVRRIVIDSLTSLRLYFHDQGPKAYRDFLISLFDMFRVEKLTAIIVTETEPSRKLGETGAGPEHFLSDTIITLRKDEHRRSLLRSLEVAKSRGQRVITGRHSFRIETANTFVVYPRAYARDRVFDAKETSLERVNFGVAGLEEMLGGGVFKGSTSLIVGISGTGKTVAGMHFLMEGLKRGENCLLTSLDESEMQFARHASQLGLDFSAYFESGQLSVLYESPLEMELDVHFNKIEALIREKSVTRAVVDSLATYESLLPHECREFMLALSSLLRNLGVTALLAYECSELLGLSQISEHLKASSLADNIILLNYVEISTALRRAITVPKTRGGAPDHETREYLIKKGGMQILDETSVPASEKVPQLPLSCYYGVLARSPTRHSPMIDESVAAGKPMPKSKIPKPVKKSKVVAQSQTQ